jgi:5'-nucleotidase/UDP-sugar diphosphatase
VPLGIGPDTHPGYPLVTFYLAGSDLRAGLELAAAGDVVGGDFVIQTSGLRAHYDASKPPFQRITSLAVGDTDVALGASAPCFRVTTSLYVAGLLGVVKSVTSNQLAVVPKLQDCSTEITNMQDRIVTTGSGPTLAELKAWQALLTYLSNQPKDTATGIPTLTPAYAAQQGRVATP